MAWTVADVMAEPVVTATPDTTFRQLVQILWDHGISGVPVVDRDRRVVGVVSESDLVLREEFPDAGRNRYWLDLLREIDAGNGRSAQLVERLRKAQAAVAGKLMTSPAVVIEPTRSLTEAARLMDREGVKRLVVVDSERRPLGVVTRSDLLKLFLKAEDRPAVEVAG